MVELSQPQSLALIESGIRAPSADNRHQVQFEAVEGGLRLWASREFLECRQQHRRILTLISFGAIAENIRIHATRYGVMFEPKWFPDGSRPDLLLDIRWQQLSNSALTTGDPLADGIGSRHTNRRFFKGPKLSAAALTQLEQEVSNIAGARVVWLDDPATRKAALRLIRCAEAERFQRQPLHEELFSSIRFDVGWNKTTEQLLPPGALGIEFFMRPFFQMLRHWQLMRALNFFGLYHLLGMRAGDLPCRLAPHLGVIVCTLPPETAALAAGQAFERLWLKATTLGLALQPMAGSTVLRFQQSAAEGASDQLRATLAEGWRALVSEGTALMVFRLGHAPPPGVVTGRPDLKNLLRHS